MERDYRFDLMRVVSAVFVIVIHICAMQWKTLDIHTGQWLTVHVYDMLAKFSVPLFFMISGRFMLDPERNEDGKTLTKKVVRIAAAFLFWTVVYTLLTILRLHARGEAIRSNLSWIVTEFFTGEYHMWYLYAIAGLYLITPLLRLITKDKKLTEYFLMLALAFQFVGTALLRIPGVHVIAEGISEEMVMQFPLGFSGYYVLGWYLYRYPVSRRVRRLILLAGLAGAVVTCGLTYFDTMHLGAADESGAAYLSLNVLAVTAAVYSAFLTRRDDARGRRDRVVPAISRWSFGIYLVHPVFLWIFEWIRFYPTFMHPLIGIPLMTVIVLALSTAAAALLRMIPKVGRLIT